MKTRDLRCAAIASVALAAVVVAPRALAQDASACRACGRVETIRTVTAVESWTPLGGSAAPTTGVGGAVGSTQPAAVSSFQIGRGGKNEGMVLLGSAGGANYKNTPRSYEKRRWEVTVKLDSGETRAVTLAYEPYVREGDRVRIAGNNVELLD
jgi:hypothetical protein